MSGSGNAVTYLVSLVVVAAIAVSSYLFYFSPTLADISDLRQQALSQRDFNETYAAQVNQLRQEFENIEELEAQLHDIQWDLPPIEDVPNTYRTIDSIIRSQPRTTVMRVEVGTPAEIFNQITLADAYAAVGRSSYVEDLEFTGLYFTQVRIEFVGPLFEVLNIVEELQKGPHRFFLVQEVVWDAVEPAAASGARPATVLGDVESYISGGFFVLTQEGTDPRLLPGEFGMYPLWERGNHTPDTDVSEAAGDI